MAYDITCVIKSLRNNGAFCQNNKIFGPFYAGSIYAARKKVNAF